MLRRYEESCPTGSVAARLREGMAAALAHVLPPAGLGASPGDAVAQLEAPQLRVLLQAAVACRDHGRCDRVLDVLAARPAAWADVEACCLLLTSAAAHDAAPVVQRLLLQPPAVEGGTPPFNPNMRVCRWGPGRSWQGWLRSAAGRLHCTWSRCLLTC